MAERAPSAGRRSASRQGGAVAAISRKVGPLPLYAWVALAVAGYLVYRHFHGGSSSALGDTAANVDTGSGTFVPASDQSTGSADSGSAGMLSGGTPSIIPNDEPAPAPTDTAPPTVPEGSTSLATFSERPPITPASYGVTVAAGTITRSGQINTGGLASDAPLRGSGMATSAHHVVRASQKPKVQEKQKKKK